MNIKKVFISIYLIFFTSIVLAQDNSFASNFLSKIDSIDSIKNYQDHNNFMEYIKTYILPHIETSQIFFTYRTEYPHNKIYLLTKADTLFYTLKVFNSHYPKEYEIYHYNRFFDNENGEKFDSLIKLMNNYNLTNQVYIINKGYYPYCFFINTTDIYYTIGDTVNLKNTFFDIINVVVYYHYEKSNLKK